MEVKHHVPLVTSSICNSDYLKADIPLLNHSNSSIIWTKNKALLCPHAIPQTYHIPSLSAFPLQKIEKYILHRTSFQSSVFLKRTFEEGQLFTVWTVLYSVRHLISSLLQALHVSNTSVTSTIKNYLTHFQTLPFLLNMQCGRNFTTTAL